MRKKTVLAVAAGLIVSGAVVLLLPVGSYEMPAEKSYLINPPKLDSTAKFCAQSAGVCLRSHQEIAARMLMNIALAFDKNASMESEDLLRWHIRNSTPEEYKPAVQFFLTGPTSCSAEITSELLRKGDTGNAIKILEHDLSSRLGPGLQNITSAEAVLLGQLYDAYGRRCEFRKRDQLIKLLCPPGSTLQSRVALMDFVTRKTDPYINSDPLWKMECTSLGTAIWRKRYDNRPL